MEAEIQVQGFESNAPVVRQQAGEMAAVKREESEIQAAIISAKKFPRDELQAYSKAIKSHQRPRLAEAATYTFPRGGSKVEGPSIDCARDLARCWGNMDYGIRVVAMDDNTVHIKGFAIDLETNNRASAEDKFNKLVQTKKGWVEPDERALRELIGRRGSILVRNAILQLLPPDLIDDAQATAKATMMSAAKGELKQNREDAIKKLVLAFSGVQVTTDMIKAKLNHDVSLITDEEFIDLKKIFKSIKDGHTSRSEQFEASGQSATGINAALAARAGVAQQPAPVLMPLSGTIGPMTVVSSGAPAAADTESTNG